MAILTNAQPEVTATNTVTLTNKTLTSPVLTDPTINGTTTNINTTNLVVEDKNIVINDVTSPSDANADGGGISLNGGTTKTLNYVNATTAWTSSENFNLASGKAYLSNGTAIKDITETLTNKTLTSPISNTATINYPILKSPEETMNIVAAAATGTINFDTTTSTIWYYTTSASANHTLNFRFSSSVTLNTSLAIGDAITVVWMNTNGATAYYPNVIQIDGSTVTPKFQNGTAFSAGNASAIDAYSFTIIKTASATFTVLASQTKFA